jgi:hypothetical protein
MMNSANVNFFWQRSGALVEAQSTARMGEDESSCASGSGREDDEPACDVSADFLAGVSCYVDRFRRASVTVRPRAKSFVVATRRTRRPSSRAPPDRRSPSPHRVSFAGAQGLNQAHRVEGVLLRLRMARTRASRGGAEKQTAGAGDDGRRRERDGAAAVTTASLNRGCRRTPAGRAPISDGARTR